MKPPIFGRPGLSERDFNNLIDEYIEAEIAEHAEKTLGGLTEEKKGILRQIIEKENAYWDREAIREDNHTGRDDQ